MFYTHLEDFINDLYLRLKIRDPYELDMHLIARRLNIPIVYRKSNFRSDDEIILVKSTKQKEWQCFAHELGHILRHVGQHLNMHTMFRQLQEYQANYFAYHFCVPTFMLVDIPNLSITKIMNLFNVEFEFAERRFSMYKNKIYLEKGLIV